MTAETTGASVFRSGLVAVVGRPNVGKSSLINRIVGQKVTIVSNKPQTTRQSIRCVYTDDKSQIVFVDTPGIHLPHHKLGEFMVETARRTLEEVDLVCYIVEASDSHIRREDARILDFLKGSSTPVILGINKVDTLRRKTDYWKTVEIYQSKVQPVEVIPFSAREGVNTDILLEKIVERLPEGPPYFPDERLIDHPEVFLAAEIIREKVLEMTRQEVPHSVFVDVEAFKTPDEYPERKNAYIRATIMVERDGQKGIVIGKGGAMLKEIGSLARLDLEELVNCKVFLELFVKVREDWRRSEKELRRMGFRF